jgi:hypothetical protein
VLVPGGRLSADSGVSKLELKVSFGFLTDQGTFASGSRQRLETASSASAD